MKAPFSSYLNGIAPGLKELITLLRGQYDYVSVLSTDSDGFSVTISQRSRNVSHETIATERGTVVRVYKNGLYAESAFTGFDPAKAKETFESITRELDAQLRLLNANSVKAYETGILPDEARTVFAEKETGRLPKEENISALVDKLSAVSDQGMKDGADKGLSVIDFHVRASSTHVCKMFLTEKQDLRQSYVYSDGMAAALVAGQERAADSKGLDGLIAQQRPVVRGGGRCLGGHLRAGAREQVKRPVAHQIGPAAAEAGQDKPVAVDAGRHRRGGGGFGILGDGGAEIAVDVGKEGLQILRGAQIFRVGAKGACRHIRGLAALVAPAVKHRGHAALSRLQLQGGGAVQAGVALRQDLAGEKQVAAVAPGLVHRADAGVDKLDHSENLLIDFLPASRGREKEYTIILHFGAPQVNPHRPQGVFAAARRRRNNRCR